MLRLVNLNFCQHLLRPTPRGSNVMLVRNVVKIKVLLRHTLVIMTSPAYCHLIVNNRTFLTYTKAVM